MPVSPSTVGVETEPVAAPPIPPSPSPLSFLPFMCLSPHQLQELLGLSLDEAEAVELAVFRSSGEMPDRSFTI